MKRILTGAALILVAAGGAMAQSKAEAEIAAIDIGWGEAYVACNAKAWEALLADDLVFIHNNGSIDNKATQVKSAAA